MYLPIVIYGANQLNVPGWPHRRNDESGEGVYKAVLAWIEKTYQALLSWVGEVIKVANEPLKQHPYVALFISSLVFLGPWILLLPLFTLQAVSFVVLHILGFGLSGITGGSPAALYQALCHGGHSPANSIFAMLQSSGTRYNVGTADCGVLVVIRVLAGAIGVYVYFGIIRSAST